ncbi:MAG TPA: outer membrane beta-barrel protein [Gemmatimonadaceae bacterium]|nr:outer membrane beta-barrel protein [Gemmatimonadaceae bacterium]
MRRTLSGLVVVGALVMGAQVAEAQAGRGLSVGIAGGWTHDARQNLPGEELGWNGSVLVERRWSIVGLRAELSYSEFGTDHRGTPCFFPQGLSELPCQLISERNNLLGLGISATAGKSRGGLRPYVIAGLGAYQLTERSRSVPLCPCPAVLSFIPEVKESSAMTFGMNGGLGLALNGSPLDVFVEARYQHLFTAGRDYGIVPISLGFRL